MEFPWEPMNEAPGATAKNEGFSAPSEVEEVKDKAAINGLNKAQQIMLEMALADVAHNRLIDHTVVESLDQAWLEGQDEEYKLD